MGKRSSSRSGTPRVRSPADSSPSPPPHVAPSSVCALWGLKGRCCASRRSLPPLSLLPPAAPAGQERFNALTDMFYRGSDAVILVFGALSSFRLP